MNKQNKPNGKRGIEWTTPFGRDGYTANIIKGCKCACAWKMGNDRAQCYAKSVAEGVAQSAYPGGFSNLRFDDKEFQTVLNHKKPSAIFMDSMSDLLGLNVPDEWIERIIELMRQKPEHIFFVLTKNPERLPDFNWSSNVWLGISAPPTYMHKALQMDCDLTTHQGRSAWFHMALGYLKQVDILVRWASLEPLSDDFSHELANVGSFLDWAVIGAASNGKKKVQPKLLDTLNTMLALRKNETAIFFKGNISTELSEAVGGWCEEYPKYEWRITQPMNECNSVQQRLFD